MPREMEIKVEVPAARATPMAKTREVKGMDRSTAAIAVSPTPRATKIPSTMVYREKAHIEAMEGRTNLRNRFRSSNYNDPPYSFALGRSQR